MRSSLRFPLLSLIASVATASNPKPLGPVVLWHGMGEAATGKTAQFMKESIIKKIPDIYIHSIQINENPDAEIIESFHGSMDSQVDEACKQLQGISALKHGFNAIGLGQGGLLMRAYVERCNNPPVKKLITLGSPHSGIDEIPSCLVASDFKLNFLCKQMQAGLKESITVPDDGKYWMPANYFKKADFLIDLNNEDDKKNDDYKHRFSALEKAIFVMFDKDTIITPKESAHWSSIVNGELENVTDSKGYQEDWIGLKTMYEGGGLEFLTLPGGHLEMTQEELDTSVIPHLIDNGDRRV